MTGSVSIPNAFAAVTTATTPNLDANFNALASYINDPTNRVNWAADTGAVNDIVANYTPAVVAGSLVNGLTLSVRAANTNTGATTFKPYTAAVARSIVKATTSGISAVGSGEIRSGADLVLVYDATNTRWLAVGGLAPTAGTAGALILLGTGTASASATIDFNGLLSATYDNYLLLGEYVLLSGANSLGIQWGTGGGPSWIAASYNYAGSEITDAPVQTLVGSTTTYHPINLNAAWPNGAGNESGSFSYTLFGANQTSRVKTANWTSNIYTSTPRTIINHGSGNSTNATALSTALTSLRILPSAGTITQGKFFLYGYSIA